MPGCMASSTSRTFSATDQRRRRCTEVMTSIRRNGSSELLDIVVLIGACLCLISYADCPVEIGCAPVGAFIGIQWVMKTVQAMKMAPSVKTEKTTIITGDTLAMEKLAATISASNMILGENNTLRREEHADREAMREALEQNTKAVEQAKDQIIEARRDIKDLTIQMARAGK
jgi:hypothetical protein